MLYPAKNHWPRIQYLSTFVPLKTNTISVKFFFEFQNMYGFFAQMIILLRGKRRVRNWKGVVAFFPTTTLLNTRVVVIGSNDTIEIQHKAKDEVMDDDESDGGGMLTVALFTRQIIH